MNNILLDVQHLNKSFGAVKASHDLSFSVMRGHIHALIGPNGAGKTTTVNQLSGDILPDSGTIMLGDSSITRLKPYQRARLGLARSYQITSIFDDLTVAENMVLSILAQYNHNFRFWRKAFNADKVRKELPFALERVDLTAKAETISAHLSHGEKRQLEVGMALIGNPELLILDEPMAGMGPGGTVALAQLINSLKGELTILLVEHDMNVVFSLADRVTVLVNGENIATGTPDEIRSNPLVRKAYLGEDA
ncbi:ABC transporter ATP-binding protein [Desulfosediminicola flagellatus]|uniref:ABC transporter ATP-binding protein n=1 Tax=Desulfosediminicola flagellatus TaxID=2569541 RepID=UPI0010AC8DF5|nr:ABC transporter ATP-binding protein [Desulfosediminicola flagellatus]